jgi:CRISPR-associated protein Csb2
MKGPSNGRHPVGGCSGRSWPRGRTERPTFPRMSCIGCSIASPTRPSTSFLTYLGRAESVCVASLGQPEHVLGDEVRPEQAGREAVAGGRVDLLVPDAPLDVEQLCVTTRAMRKGKTLHPPGASKVSYVVPERTPPLPKPRVRVRRAAPTAVRFALDAKTLPSRLSALAVGDVLRQAAIKRAPASGTLSGHRSDVRAREDQHQHAHYLPFSADRRRGPRLLDTAVVWAPSGLSPEEVSALAGLTWLSGRAYLSDFREAVHLAVEAVGPVNAVAPELSSGATDWESFTPFAPPRHWKRGPIDDYVIEAVDAELAHRGLPHAQVELLQPSQSTWPVSGGWLSFRRHRPSKEKLRDAAWAYGIRLRFEEPVPGPVVLGKSSHMGLGLFLPVG